MSSLPWLGSDKRKAEIEGLVEAKKDLVETIDTLERAIGIIQKEMNGRRPLSLRLWLS